MIGQVFNDSPENCVFVTGGNGQFHDREIRIHTRQPGDKYMDADSWMEAMEVNAGSWWPMWDQWLDQRMSGTVAPPASGAPRKGLKALRDAPGEYVFG